MKAILNYFLTAGLGALLLGCGENSKPENGSSALDSSVVAKERKGIDNMLDSFNIAAANADYNGYFNCFTEDAVFMGTDATEYWTKDSFMLWAKPHFDKGKAWNFKSLERHIYFYKTGDIAWFDELLTTQMKICRGSGVLLKQGKGWKIKQYVLSMTVPNSRADSVIKIKSAVEDEIIKRLKQE